ncbi:MAG: DUF4835 family protein [Bacteroidota bacterium]|nr:DUF4835 family protein [Bacteroidota bacterium]
MKFLIGIFFLLFNFSTYNIFAQEFNFVVKVNQGKAQITDKNVFTEMEKAFSQFLNTRKWTNDVYSAKERINCNLVITLNEKSTIGSYEAIVQVQAARPVFETNYQTMLLNFADRDWAFEYQPSQPMEFSEQVFSSNITAMLSFYAYIILGLDYDSFGKLQGNPFYEKAFNIVTNAQQTNFPGWKQFNSNRNRYWLAENLMNQQVLPLREGSYLYHRQGMDIFATAPDDARKNILQALKNVKKVNEARPNTIAIIAFLDAKTDELVHVFSKGDMAVRREAYTILSALDPTKISKMAPMIK